MEEQLGKATPPAVASDPDDAVDAARAAALARSSKSLPHLAEQQDIFVKEFRLKLLKIIDDEIMGGPYPRPQALSALELLQTLLANAISDPAKRSVRLSNPALMKRLGNRLLLDGPFTTFLHECGFRHEVIQFEARRTFPTNPKPEQLQRLEIGREIISTRQQMILRSHETNEKAKEADKEAERTRTPMTRRHIEDDRAAVRVRVEREQASRRRPSADTASIAAPPPPLPPPYSS